MSMWAKISNDFDISFFVFDVFMMLSSVSIVDISVALSSFFNFLFFVNSKISSSDLNCSSVFVVFSVSSSVFIVFCGFFCWIL